MDHFSYRNHELYCEDVRVSELAKEFGTPLYIYSQATILHHLETLQKAFAQLNPLVCYSVKANSNLGILKLVGEHGSGFDVVSGGELARVLTAGGSADKTVFAGVGKTDSEIAAAIEAGVLMFNVESEAELEAINRVAMTLNKQAPVALRVNPDVDPKTHRYISTGKKESKFGMDIDRSLRLAQEAINFQGIRMIGMHMHIGSQITSVEPYGHAAEKGVEIIGQMRAMGHPIEWYNMGGGFGIAYRGTEAKAIEAFAEVIVPRIATTGCRLAMEPGRVVVGNAGVLISQVIYNKKSGDKRFLIQDAAMNDLLRPSLYEAFHRIWPVQVPENLPCPPENYESEISGTQTWDVVGPVCESGDFLAKDRHLPEMNTGDYLATFSSGAYGMVMASNYNTRPRAAEILVSQDKAKLIRRRETIEDLIGPERMALES
ncbi:MAG: Diaminopimelate decarboxylase [Planctomycetota bacterium]|jgi:diaminopimelate decarboxylase